MEHPPWDIRREGRRWTREEVEHRLYQAPEKIEFAGGIFTSERERLTVLAMLLENLGIDRVVRLGKLLEHPEIMTQGETLEELEENLRDAYRYLNPATGQKQPVPRYTDVDDALAKHIKKYLSLKA